MPLEAQQRTLKTLANRSSSSSVNDGDTLNCVQSQAVFQNTHLCAVPLIGGQTFVVDTKKRPFFLTKRKVTPSTFWTGMT